MRVAFLTYSFSMHINIKAKYFSKSNDKVYFFAMHPRQRTKDLDAPLEYRNNMVVTQLIHDDMDWEQIIKNTWKMFWTIRKNKVQIVHIIDMAFAIYGILLSLLGVNVILENNGSDVILASNDPKLRKRYELAYKLCKGVVQDSYVAQQAGIKLGAPSINNEIIELGIDTSVFNPDVEKGVFKKKYNIPKDAKVIFSPRTLRPLCNIGEIIDTIKPVLEQYPNTYYVFCSHMRNITYENRIKQEGLNNHVIYLGYIDNEKEMPYIYRDSDIVISIPNSDSSPRSVYEAMACGSNVIVSDLPWIGNKFANNKELYIVKVHDEEELLNRIMNILSGRTEINVEIAFNRIKQILDYRISEKKPRKIYTKIIRRKNDKRLF